MRGCGCLVIFGLLFIVGGLSGEYVLRGTHSPEALWILGIILVVVGILGLIIGGQQPDRNAGQLPSLEQPGADLDKALRQQIAHYTKAIELDPHDAIAYVERGLAHVQLGDVQQGMVDCDKAIELAPDHPLMYIIRATAYLRVEDLPKAIADYDKAIELDPDDAGAYRDRGRIHDRRGDAERAIADLEKTLSLDPDQPFAWGIRQRVEELKRL